MENEQSWNGTGSFEAKFKPAITGKIGNVPLILKKSEFTSSQMHMLYIPQNVERGRKLYLPLMAKFKAQE
jgi:hypothetical protein